MIKVAILLGLMLAVIGCTAGPTGLPPGYNETEYTERIEEFNTTWLLGGTGVPGHKPWIVYAIIAVFLMGMFAVFVYVIGYGFGLEPLKRYAMSELLQAVASAVLISFIVFFLYTIVVFLVNSFFGGPDAYALCGEERITVMDPIQFAQCKVREKISRIEEMWDAVYESNEGMERFASQCWTVLGITFYCNDWVGSIRKQVGMAHTLGDRIISLEFILQLQYSMLSYILMNMLPFFLPIGLLLRIFPPTRGLGGLFIAMAIGFHFIYPTVVFILDPSYRRQPLTLPPSFDIEDMKECYQGFRGAVALTTSTFLIDRGGYSLISYETVGDRLAYVTIEAIYIPFVALVITLVFIRALSGLFGAAPAHMMRLVTRFG